MTVNSALSVLRGIPGTFNVEENNDELQNKIAMLLFEAYKSGENMSVIFDYCEQHNLIDEWPRLVTKERPFDENLSYKRLYSTGLRVPSKPKMPNRYHVPKKNKKYIGEAKASQKDNLLSIIGRYPVFSDFLNSCSEEQKSLLSFISFSQRSEFKVIDFQFEDNSKFQKKVDSYNSRMESYRRELSHLFKRQINEKLFNHLKEYQRKLNKFNKLKEELGI